MDSHQTQMFSTAAETDPPVDVPGGVRSAPKPRLLIADRDQTCWEYWHLDSTLPAEHCARTVWQWCQQVDLSPLLRNIRAVENSVGRTAIDPAILLALWLYSTLEGIGSARHIARLCKDHAAWKWICGGVDVSHHTLSIFRTANVEFLNDLLTQSVATLVHAKLVTMKRVAQDGMRVRASAGTSSFRRESTLEKLVKEALEQVAHLQRELDDDPAASDRRYKKRELEESERRVVKISKALEKAKKLRAKAKPDKREQVRASTTDADASKMKMPDGGFRPAFNVESATDTESGIVVGVDVTSQGSDAGRMTPMQEQLEQRYGIRAQELLADGNFAVKDDITKMEKAGSRVYSPVMERKSEKKRSKGWEKERTPQVQQWRERMEKEESKKIYKVRAQTAEWVNAGARNRGLRQFNVRGLLKAKAVVLWHALAHNFQVLKRQGWLEIAQ